MYRVPHKSLNHDFQVQGAARRTLELLQKVTSAEAAFDAAFLPRHPPTASYDYFWRVALPPQAAAGLVAADLSECWSGPMSWQKHESLGSHAI